jgi:hypothetical protein
MTPIPIRFGSQELFARVREMFLDRGFSDEEVIRRLKESKDALEPDEPPNVVRPGATAQDLLVGLFLKFSSAPDALCVSLLGDDALKDLAELGLIRSEDGQVRATVRIRPLGSLFVLSDTWDPNPGGDKIIDDVVYPPDITNTLNYLSYIPLSPCERFLEVCGGSGVAALIAASCFASKAYSYDIADRSTQFARFSGMLNGLDNFEAATGDAYEPANGLTFDRIAAHPPYVPVLKHTWVFHAGGNDGEQISRKCIADLPRHLAQGGRFYCRCLGSDRDTPYEQRVREWLGDQQDEFDIAVAVLRVVEPVQFFSSGVLRGSAGPKDFDAWKRLFETLKISRFLQVVIVIQRRTESRPVFTVRREHGLKSGPRELDWLLRWETEMAKGAEKRILTSLLKPGQVRLTAENVIRDGDWGLNSQRLLVDYPYYSNWEVDPLAAYLIPRLESGITGAQLREKLIGNGAIAGDFPPDAFAKALGEMISMGYIEIEGEFELPAAPEI